MLSDQEKPECLNLILKEVIVLIQGPSREMECHGGNREPLGEILRTALIARLVAVDHGQQGHTDVGDKSSDKDKKNTNHKKKKRKKGSNKKGRDDKHDATKNSGKNSQRAE